jgi:hypothetical protein
MKNHYFFLSGRQKTPQGKPAQMKVVMCETGRTNLKRKMKFTLEITMTLKRNHNRNTTADIIEMT